MDYPCLALFLLLLVAHKISMSYCFRWVFGIVLAAFLFCMGVALIQQQPQQSSLPVNTPVKVVAVVSDEPTVGLRFTKYSMRAVSYYDSTNVSHPVSEKLFVYIRNDSTSSALLLGDEALFSAKLSAIPPPQNPGEFDYATYLQRRQIFCSTFVNADNYLVVASKQLSNFIIFYKTVRKDIMAFFATHGIGGEEFAVLQALTIGDKSLLDADLRNSYSRAGAVHILAVSGMHVGIIVMILGFALKPLERRRYGRMVRGTILLLLLWFYALLAGLAPSVMRATVMFSVATVGGMFTQRTNIYNTLSFAAFLLCVLDPYSIYDAGFQLSFCAVLTIVFFQRRILDLLHFKNRFLNWLWDLIAVSVAANIGTFPIAVFIFHQFPLYFILTNVLITVPTFLVMFGFLISLAFCWVPYLNDFLCLGLKYIIELLNLLIRFIESLPGGLAEALNISTMQLWLLVTGILLASFFIWIKRRALFVAALAVFVAFLAIRAYVKYEQHNQHLLAVYSIKNTSLISFIDGRNGFLVCDSADFGNDFAFNLNTHAAGLGLANFGELGRVALQGIAVLQDSAHAIYKGCLVHDNYLVKILTDESARKLEHKLTVDYLILTSRCKLRPQQVFDMYSAKLLIVDASMPAYVGRIFENFFTEQGVPCHNVRSHGAYVAMHH
ncbi:MAG: ComEC family competence protein [Prevotellaceae bacterium]|nr:ComEC family competence protein [Prevotellaceae bacterium]